MSHDKYESPLRSTVENLAQAIFTVNRHAKTAPNPKYLYRLKHEALKKLLKEGKAKKIGLHFSKNPKFSQQQSDVLVECGKYSFHIPPSKQDFQTLPHLGKLNHLVRNPKTRLSLNEAKKMLELYTCLKEDKHHHTKNKHRQPQKPVFKRLGESYF
ncbi:YkyB family protein [Bacillus aquiflavi]|uniref:YkyB family protein n=1 Tax=Bacillus aquiflavi TaxID=2672567 RepID=UPI001FE8AAC3|nr:YkyB family protein [Bacillus aquiflavi]